MPKSHAKGSKMPVRQNVARNQSASVATTQRGRTVKNATFTGARVLARPGRRRSTHDDQLGNRRWPHFRRILAALRVNCAPPLPVIVQVGRVQADARGWCARGRRTFVIRLSSELREAAAMDVLVHEWAHAMAWSPRPDQMIGRSRTSALAIEAADHGPDWGVAYARAYLVFAWEAIRINREHRSAKRRRVEAPTPRCRCRTVR